MSTQPLQMAVAAARDALANVDASQLGDSTPCAARGSSGTGAGSSCRRGF